MGFYVWNRSLCFFGRNPVMHFSPSMLDRNRNVFVVRFRFVRFIVKARFVDICNSE